MVVVWTDVSEDEGLAQPRAEPTAGAKAHARSTQADGLADIRLATGALTQGIGQLHRSPVFKPSLSASTWFIWITPIDQVPLGMRMRLPVQQAPVGPMSIPSGVRSSFRGSHKPSRADVPQVVHHLRAGHGVVNTAWTNWKGYSSLYLA